MLRLLLAAALLAPSPLCAQPAAPAARPRPPLKVATLSNGLKLLCRTNDASEIVSIVCLVRAGTPDETEEQAGLAAVTAEALIRGTSRQTDQQFAQAVATAGGNLRSLPGFDFTEISIVAGREQFNAALRLLADVVAHPRFAEDDLKAAREAVKQRLAGVQDDFTGGSYQALASRLYPNTPYGRPVQGYAETVDRITLEDVKRFWDRNYVQNRITVAVVGDVDAAKALDLAQKTFQDVPFRPGSVTPVPPTSVLRRPSLELLERPGPAAQVMVGFLAPGTTRENYPVYAVLDAIVGGGKRARLFANIREKHSLGYELGSFYQPLLFQSHLVGYVITPPSMRDPRTEEEKGVLDLVKTHLLEQFHKLAETGPTDQELARARNYVLGRYALRQERTRDQAKWLAWNTAMKLGADFDGFFSTRVPTVTKQQVQAAAKQSLGSYALVVTIPKAEGM